MIESVRLTVRPNQNIVKVNISAENNSTVVFPVPIDILSHFVNKNKVRAEETFLIS